MSNNNSMIDSYTYQSKAYHIYELLHKMTPELSNLIIIEDGEDTKNITLEELLRFFITNNEIHKLKTYSSDKIEKMFADIEKEISLKGDSSKLKELEARLADIISSSGEGKDTELIDARNGQQTLNTRLSKDYEYLNNTKANIIGRTVNNICRDGIYRITNLNGNKIGKIECILDNGTDNTNEYIITIDDQLNDPYNITIRNKEKTEININTNSEVVFKWISEDIEYIQFMHTVYDVDITYLKDAIDNIIQITNNKHDNCNLLSSIGIYKSCNLLSMISSSDIKNCKLEEDIKKIRNGSNSIKVITNKNETKSSFKFPINDSINIDTVTFIFYISGDDIEKMVSSDKIDLFISYDSGVESNGYKYSISKNELIPGWNNLKKSVTNLMKVGNINNNDIDHVKIEMSSGNLPEIDIWFNGIVFNQMMKPKMLLCFNGFYDDCVSSVYPYLVAKDIPATVFINGNSTLQDSTMDKLVDLKCNNRWSIGCYGCHPNKELLTLYDNPREQYMLLRDTKKYVEENYCYSPIAYSAPFGKIRDITVPLLKDFKYKMARVETDDPSYISIFTDNDFAFPVIKCGSNTDIDHIKDCIEYAISTGQSIALYTSHITEYGDESSMTQTDFELLVDYLKDLSKSGRIECLSVDDFYNQCIN